VLLNKEPDSTLSYSLFVLEESLSLGYCNKEINGMLGSHILKFLTSSQSMLLCIAVGKLIGNCLPRVFPSNPAFGIWDNRVIVWFYKLVNTAVPEE